MNATIEIDGLRKRFGPVQALDGMTFTVQPGHVTGFVGPNGAGKSTTMRIVLGLDAPDAGTATIGGRPYRSLQNPLTHVGSLLDAGALQPGRSARNHLMWLAHSQGLKAGRVDEVLTLAGLEPAARRKAGGYSLGMRQRLGIAAALLGDPPVLIFVPYLLALVPPLVPGHGLARGGFAQGGLSLVAREWLLRITPAAGFSVQQAVPQFSQVAGASYTPNWGYYPLAPWAGLAVECAWAAAGLTLAFYLLRKRDA